MKSSIAIWVLFIFMGVSCHKSKFLDEKPNQALVIPKTINELQAILNNVNIMNGISEAQIGVNPSLGEAACDDYYIIDGGFELAQLSSGFRNIYTWSDGYGVEKFYDWAYPYRVVLYSNVVLEGLKKISPKDNEQPIYDNVKGSALFFKAEMYYQLAQIFCQQYEKEIAETALGVVLKHTADLNEAINRSSLKKTYEEIIESLLTASDLLPDKPKVATSPSKAAAFGLLARVYLTMKDYENALKYSGLSLDIQNELIDYNTLDRTSPFPINKLNKEVVFHSVLVQTNISNLFLPFICKVDTNLYRMYEENDLRKEAFFIEGPSGVSFKGSYDGTVSYFGGIAVDEIVLINAECNLRLGNVQMALDALNYLLKNRWRNTVIYPTIDINDSDLLLQKILDERRKELLFRGVRWTDIRRLNNDGANITIHRKINGNEFSLLPNSLQYVFLIPDDVILFNPSLQQNPR